MPTYEWIVPADVDITPCPGGAGGLTGDPYGGPCKACWDAVDDKAGCDAWWAADVEDDGEG